jgi:hypothetical protein
MDLHTFEKKYTDYNSTWPMKCRYCMHSVLMHIDIAIEKYFIMEQRNRKGGKACKIPQRWH